MVVERGAVRRSKIVSLLRIGKYVMEHEADLWGDDACHRPVGLSALQLSKLYHAVLYDGGAIPKPGRMPGPQLFADFAGFPKKSTNDTGGFMW